MICPWCGFDGRPDRGIAPRPHHYRIRMCASCRGILQNVPDEEEEEEVSSELYDCVD